MPTPVPKTLALAAGLLLTACTNARLGVGLPEAIIYKNVTTPMNAGIDRATGEPMQIPENLAVGTSTAYAIDLSLPGLEWTRPLSVGWGKMDLDRALQDGNLEKVSYADGQEISILRIFKKGKVIAYGPRGTE